MLLKRQLKLLALIAGAALAAGMAASGVSSYDVSEETHQIEHAENTVRGITNFRYLTMEMALYGEARTRQQWHERFRSFERTLSGYRYGSVAEQALLEREQNNLRVLDRLFARLEAEKAEQPGSLAGARGNAIVSSMFMTTQDMLDDGFELIRLNRIDLRNAQQRAVGSIIASIVLLAALIMLAIATLRRRVLKPLASLQRVTEQVTRGDLGARLHWVARDEMGSLGSAFDHMTSQLQQSHDATQRQSAELVLAQESLQGFIDYTPALVGYWDKELRNRFANRAYESWLGLAPREMRGQYIADVIGADRFALIEHRLRSVLQGNSEIFEGTVRMQSGELRDTLFSYMPDIRQGEVEGIYGFVSDITPLKRAEAGRAQASSQLHSVVSAAGDFAILQVDTAGIIRLFSTGAERLLGYPAAEVVGSATPALFHVGAEVAERASVLASQLGREIAGFDIFSSIAARGESETREWTWVRKDGATLPVSLTVSAMRSDGGRIVGYVGIATDISAERDTRRVLAEARDQAEQASLAKSRFLANMSHEIRTPMNAVLGMLELLQYTDLNGLQRDYASKSQLAARSLLGVLNDILDFSQVEAGKIELESATFDIDAMLCELSAILATLAGARAVELVYAVEADVPPFLQGDVTRLRQVLINLASNAVKFTDHGEVVVAVRLLRQTRTHSTVEFAVRDTGIGIAQDKLATIFEGFTQAEASTTRRFGGTGLGLTISQRLVALMGGELRVDSAAGAGSSFHFALDFVRGPIEERRGQPSLLQGSLRVLVAQPNSAARDASAVMAGALGWHALCAADSGQALTLLTQRCDVALVDWSMEGAAALARRLSAGDTRAPVVAIVSAQGRSMLAAQLIAEQDLVAGMLVKPFTQAMLRDAVNGALTGLPVTGLQVAALPVTDRLAGERLLVVDDNSMNQQVARELLAHEGAEVSIAGSGEEALRLITDGARFDAILMDVQMPGMDGFACTRALRAIDALHDTPIIAMTANVMASDREDCLAPGMSDHLGKPLDIETMVELLLQHIRGERQGERRPAAPGAAAAPLLVDFGAALQRMGGNRTLFVTLTHAFAAEAERFRERIGAALPDADWQDAAAVLHTFKSAAGTVGAAALQACVTTLETAVRSEPEQIDVWATLDDLDELIDRSLREIAAEWGTGVPVQAAPAAPGAQRGKPLVMVIDDQAINIQILHALLGERYDVCMALDGTAGLALCAQRRPDIILLDIVMPGMDGYEVCARLKGDPATRDIPLVFVSGHQDPVERARGMAAGAVDFILKPFDAHDVHLRVHTHCAAGEAARGQG